MKYYYPAIFEKAEDTGGFIVTVPAIKGCYTQGENLMDAMYWTVDAIGTMLEGVDAKDYPKPYALDIKEYPNAIINTIEFDPEDWLKNY